MLQKFAIFPAKQLAISKQVTPLLMRMTKADVAPFSPLSHDAAWQNWTKKNDRKGRTRSVAG